LKDNLLIITKIKRFIETFDTLLNNYPKVEKVLKNNLEKELYLLLEISYMANISINKLIYQQKLLVRIKLIDYYCYCSFKKGIISYKKYTSIVTKLIEIQKMLYGWINYEKKKQSL